MSEYANLEHAMDAALEHLSKQKWIVELWNKTLQETPSRKDQIVTFICPSVASLQDVPKFSEHPGATLEHIRTSSIYRSDYPDTDELEFLESFCIPYDQTLIMVLCRARQSAPDFIIKGAIASPYYTPCHHRAHLSAQASKTIKMHILDRALEPERSILPVCGFCGTQTKEVEEAERCGDCLAVFYCNEACQSADWEIHQYDCRKRKMEQEQARAFLAAEDEKKCSREENATATSVDNVSKCNHCGIRGDEKDLLVCSGCMEARYCGEECQSADRAHQYECWLAEDGLQFQFDSNNHCSFCARPVLPNLEEWPLRPKTEPVFCGAKCMVGDQLLYEKQCFEAGTMAEEQLLYEKECFETDSSMVEEQLLYEKECFKTDSVVDDQHDHVTESSETECFKTDGMANEQDNHATETSETERSLPVLISVSEAERIRSARGSEDRSIGVDDMSSVDGASRSILSLIGSFAAF